MLGAFVIGLREGVESALIVVIVATFLRKSGRVGALRPMWTGVAIAVALCLGVGIVLNLLNESLPERQQEIFETFIALIAAGAVTYMIVWIRRHAHTLRTTLESSAAHALAAGSSLALVGMAFFAVLREGLETSVFLVAAFQRAASPLLSGAGAILGVVAAIVLGYGIYRGGLKIDLARFFRITGLVLVLVAAGLVSGAAHTGHEAGLFNALQGQAVDLSWLITPGSVVGALVTSMFGLQPQPTVGEALIWLLYAVPMGTFVMWPQRQRPRSQSAQQQHEVVATSTA